MSCSSELRRAPAERPAPQDGPRRPAKAQKGLLQRSDHARLVITAAGVEYLEQNYAVVNRQKLLEAANDMS